MGPRVNKLIDKNKTTDEIESEYFKQKEIFTTPWM